MRLLLALVLLATAGCAVAGPPYGRVRLATFSLGVPGGTCSATAVGRYTLLTATHCVSDGAMAVTVNGKQCEVFKIVNDGHDHALLVISRDCPQAHTASFGREPLIGESVFCWGSPGSFQHMLRTGFMVGRGTMPKDWGDDDPIYKNPAMFFTGAFAHGDSGAALFDKWGHIVGVVSFGTGPETSPSNLFMGSFSLSFTADQMTEAGL